MLEGLRETQRELRERGIRSSIRLQPPVEAVKALAPAAALVVTDCGYLRTERHWRERAARRLPCRLVQVESDVIVPVETASQKEEYAAYTIRPRIHKHLDKFLVALEQTPLERDSLGLEIGGANSNVALDNIDRLLEQMRINRSAGRVDAFTGGTAQAKALLDDFIAHKLSCYADGSNEPSADCLSSMSPYLHFGQISPIYIALRVKEAKDVTQENRNAYLEQLIVRRELSMNFCHYNPDYDTLACLPDWARETLEEHAHDRREHLYTPEEFEAGRTHDPYWNAAQREMIVTGKMHSYMRMYWGKKILEWTPRPAAAHRIALELNNRYELDGRDPNGFTGVAWCFGKHDRAWKERSVYGKTRYMSANGLERKFEIGAYVQQIQQLMEEARKTPLGNSS
jgi:deoxyribodipyrimidine photo-lyase